MATLGRRSASFGAVETEIAPVLANIPSAPRLELTNLFNIAEWQHEIAWQPYKDGLEIYRLYGDGLTGPTAALLRFQKAGRVPRHQHGGYEHILVLTGAQRDEVGESGAGTLVVNAPGTTHAVVSEAGCIVLAIYEKPVRFL